MDNIDIEDMKSSLIAYRARLSPNACIRDASVVGLMSRSSAAPLAPYTFQRACSSAVRMFSYSRRLRSAYRKIAVEDVALKTVNFLGLVVHKATLSLSKGVKVHFWSALAMLALSWRPLCCPATGG